MPKSLPCLGVCAFDLDGINVHVGTTWFLAHPSGSHWLVTCAHLPTNLQPTNEFEKWPQSIHVFNSNGQDCEIDLFVNTNNGRMPVFRWWPMGGRRIADIMAIELPSEHFSDQGFLNEAQMLTCTPNVIGIPEGKNVTIYGFPKQEKDWQFIPMSSLQGPFIRLNINMYEAKLGSIEGYSGGPAFIDGDRFIGMLIGSNDDNDRIISQSTIYNLITHNRA